MSRMAITCLCCGALSRRGFGGPFDCDCDCNMTVVSQERRFCIYCGKCGVHCQCEGGPLGLQAAIERKKAEQPPAFEPSNWPPVPGFAKNKNKRRAGNTIR